MLSVSGVAKRMHGSAQHPYHASSGVGMFLACIFLVFRQKLHLPARSTVKSETAKDPLSDQKHRIVSDV